jgi:hypothetical protein
MFHWSSEYPRKWGALGPDPEPLRRAANHAVLVAAAASMLPHGMMRSRLRWSPRICSN